MRSRETRSDDKATKAAAGRRFGTEKPATRAQLLDATLELLVEEGYAAVSGRKVASKAGLNASLVHYYFPTTDDLLVAAYRRGAEQSLERHREAAESDEPWDALWALSTDPSRTALAMEFMALANHRKSIRAEIARYAEEIRTIQANALERGISDGRFDLGPCTPAAATVLLAGIARVLVMEEGVGIFGGHADTREFLAWLFTRLKQRGDDRSGPTTP
ncbi:TetR/AcrR family transcriptional regulator [Sphingomonas sp. LaA6.9]|uniref:TetR/AcrR family transcriptional regulator n=1 Tax=Sphingomonas sp. LaA6.9 TaxID=2919914 RepID=UPI001F4F4E12|nr:TetR/AcrR family transcriptional regulator [Sphingomonas sp. LaA6.9]MCJ8159103.1 TetR/AcrR family transcriptional regulator [Sphingomonas sp. LaA6.9]